MKNIKNIKEIKEILEKEELICLYFSTDTCNVCKVLRPKVAQLIDKFNNVEAYYINTDIVEEAKGEYMIFAVPVIALYYNKKELIRFNRFVTISEIEQYIKKFLSFLEN